MSVNLTPEDRARVLIDQQLIAAGWDVQDRKDINLVAHTGVAVRETYLNKDAGRADYILYVERKIVGVIEAKPSGTTLSAVHWQAGISNLKLISSPLTI
jgi:type I restriction enzyme, R subunit